MSEMGGSVDPDAIERVEVLVPRDYLPFVAEPYEVKVRPRNTVDSQFSSYYAVAVALLTGRALLDEFSEEKIRDPEVLGLAAKTEIRADADVQKLYPALYPSRVIVTMKDGTTYDHMVETAKGDPEWDLTQDELEERFRTLAGRVFDEDRVERLLDTVMHLEEVDDAADLMRLCVR
jgi:2-methylcitrate dehydratase PrpD